MQSNKKVIDSLISRTKIYLGIIAILLIIICIYEKTLWLPSSIVYALIVAYSILVDKKRKGQITEHIDELMLDIDSIAKGNLIHSPFLLVILEQNGNIIWRSSRV